MTDQPVLQSQVEESGGGWDALSASVHELIRRRPSLASSRDTSWRPRFVKRIDHGHRAVPIYKIVLTEAPREHFERFLGHPRPRVHAPARLGGNQPIDVYQVGDLFFIKDGHRRVADARARGLLFLSANVTEFILDTPTMRQNEIIDLLIQHERDEFFSRHAYAAPHPALLLESRILGSYARLSWHIELFRSELLKMCPEAEHEAHIRWYDDVYRPIAHTIQSRGIATAFPSHGEADLYIWAIERRGEWRNAETLSERLRVARRSLLALASALRRYQRVEVQAKSYSTS